MDAKKPARVLKPTALAFPIWTASGIMAKAIMVSIAPAAIFYFGPLITRHLKPSRFPDLSRRSTAKTEGEKTC
jgi:hypothetical protein